MKRALLIAFAAACLACCATMPAPTAMPLTIRLADRQHFTASLDHQPAHTGQTVSEAVILAMSHFVYGLAPGQEARLGEATRLVGAVLGGEG